MDLFRPKNGDLRYKLYENGIITISSEHRRELPKVEYSEKKIRTFTIDRKIYRKLVSSCVNLYSNRVNNVVFFTLTFPQIGSVNGDGTYEGASQYDIFANRSVSDFIENLKKNYKLNSYVGVKEYHKSGVPHFHFLFDIPFVDIKKVNLAWCRSYVRCASAVGVTIDFSPNSVRLPSGRNRAVVKSLGGIVRYLGKYISKSRGDGTASNTRIYFVSRNVCSRPRDVAHDVFIALDGTFRNRLIQHKYSSTVIMNDVVFPNRDSEQIKKVNEILDRIVDREKMISVCESRIKFIEDAKRGLELQVIDLRAQYEIVLNSINVVEPVVIRTEHKQKTTRK